MKQATNKKEHQQQPQQQQQQEIRKDSNKLSSHTDTHTYRPFIISPFLSLSDIHIQPTNQTKPMKK